MELHHYVLMRVFFFLFYVVYYFKNKATFESFIIYSNAVQWSCHWLRVTKIEWEFCLWYHIRKHSDEVSHLFFFDLPILDFTMSAMGYKCYILDEMWKYNTESHNQCIKFSTKISQMQKFIVNYLYTSL
jgi:hypothetical protein